MPGKPVPDIRTYDVEALRLILRISRRAIRRLCRTGVLAARKCGNFWLISEPALEDYLMGREPSGSGQRADKAGTTGR